MTYIRVFMVFPFWFNSNNFINDKPALLWKPVNDLRSNSQQAQNNKHGYWLHILDFKCICLEGNWVSEFNFHWGSSIGNPVYNELIAGEVHMIYPASMIWLHGPDNLAENWTDYQLTQFHIYWCLPKIHSPNKVRSCNLSWYYCRFCKDWCFPRVDKLH